MEKSPNKQQILVLEDDPGILENVVEILEEAGYEVKSAMDGKTGVTLALEWMPDLVLCDINMPEMDGLEVLLTIRKDERLATLPFIFLTAEGKPDDFRRGMKTGADDYLVKPFKAKDLLDSIKSVLKRLQLRESASSEHFDHLRKELSTMLPHELRTPLNSILNFSEILHTDWEELSPDEIKEYTQMILEGGKRLERISTNLMLFIQLRSTNALESFQDGVTYTPEDLLQATQSQIKELHPDAPATEYQINGPIEISLPYSLLQKAVFELWDNAIKFSGKKAVRITCQENDSHLTWTVEDQGPGISTEQINHIGALVQFDRKKKEQQGIGMGLALVNEIVSLLGGTFTVNSHPDTGNRMILRFPTSGSGR